MATTMRGARRAVMLAVLVVGLLFGLVVMHHASAAGSHGETTSTGVQESAHNAVSGVTVPRLGGSSGAVDEGGGHGGVDSSVLLHLCLAILAGVGLILAGSRGWRGFLGRWARSVVSVVRPAPSPSAPPSSAPARLALLCVLRT